MTQAMKTLNGTYRLIGPWDGPKKYAGRNWEIQCDLCKRARIVNSSIWNASTLSCRCSRKDARGATGRRSVVYLTHNGETHSIADWATIAGIPKASIYNRFHRRTSGSTKGDRNDPRSDEWVIFGTDKTNPAVKEEPSPSLSLERSLKVLKEKLAPAIQDAILEAIDTEVRPLMYGWQKRGYLNEPSETPVDQGLLPSAWQEREPDAYYDPKPHPNDDQWLWPNATYRDIRMDIGDEAAKEMFDPELFESYRQIHLNETGREGVYAFFHDIKAREQAQAQEKEEESRRLRKEQEETHKRELQERKDAERRENPLLFILDQTPLLSHSPLEELNLQAPLPLTFPAQDASLPLTDEEVSTLFALPWWDERREYQTESGVWKDYRYPMHVAGTCLRSMFDRIVAWSFARGQDLGSNQIYRVLAATEEYGHCTDQRMTNFELDFQYCEGWVKRNRHLKKERDAILEHIPATLERWYAQIDKDATSDFRNLVTRRIRAVLQAFGRRDDSELRKEVEAKLSFEV